MLSFSMKFAGMFFSSFSVPYIFCNEVCAYLLWWSWNKTWYACRGL